MKKILLSLTLTLLIQYAFSQSDTFDIFSYKVPQFFSRQTLANTIVLSMSEKSGIACTITLYKGQPSKEDDTANLIRQWNNEVRKRYNGATSKPQLHTGAIIDNWKSTLGIGKSTINKKSNIIMLNSYSNSSTTGFIIYSFNDPIYKGPIEFFAENLKLLPVRDTAVKATSLQKPRHQQRRHLH
jgi:hypothetical protein